MRSAEEVFRDNLRETAAGWRRRLEASTLSVADADAIRQEASELRRIAQSRGWGVLARALQKVEVAPRETAGSLAREVAGLSDGLNAIANIGPVASADAGKTVRLADVPVPPGVKLPAILESTGQRAAPESIPLPPMLDAAPAPAPGKVAAADDARAAGGSPPPRGMAAAAPQLADERERDLKQAAPKLLVKTMLGFRAFKGKPPAPGEGASPPAVSSPPAGPTPLLGLSRPASKALDPPTFPPAVRPVLRPEESTAGEKPFPRGPGRGDKARTGARRERSGSARTRPQETVPRWLYAVGGGVAFLMVAVIVVIVASHARKAEPLPTPAASSVVQGDAAPTTLAQTQPAATAAAPAAPLKESDELRALIEEQGRRIAACKRDPSTCNKWSRSAEAPAVAATLTRHGSMPGWLKRLTLPRDFPPDFPDDDDVALKQTFDWDSKNRVGRKEFSTRYFRCGEFSEVFSEAILKYDAPAWLRAVAYQESGCIIDAESGVHAKGLWQFMAESARAYGLKVSEGEIDERLDPVKATDAAIHFLSDLQQALGSWDLALAAYNMGPWGVFGRVKQLGGHATFWDLYQARLLPEETAGYVPAIEAFALVLDNLVTLRLAGLPAKRPWPNDEITDLPEGTRLSLIARAARTSTSEIKAMNRAYLKGVLPKGETTAWVPQSGAQLATEFFKNPLPDDGLDACVPETFNWGGSTLPETYAQGCPRKP